jgi:FkbM family methyltransferase
MDRKMAQSARKPLNWMVTLALKSFIALCGLFLAAWTALNFYPGLSILPFATKAKLSPFCTVWKGVRDAQVKVDQGEIERKLLAQSHMIRIEPGYKLWSTPDGEFWVPDTSDEILAILLAQQRRRIYGDADHGGVKAGDVVLDCGAHIGTYVKTALDAGASKIIAIEPSPEALVCLRRNFGTYEASGKLVIYPKGVWDEEKRLVFYANGNGAAGDSFVTKGEDARPIADVPVTTVDKIVKELGLPRVDLIKADIKGAGTRMVKGAADTIRQFHPRIIISTEEAPEDPAASYSLVMSLAPSYQFRAGPCLFTGDEIRNDTIFFQ